MQLKQLQLERPDLASVLIEYPTICSWQEECFSGKFVGERIYWDNRMPFSQKYAEYSTGESSITTLRISERAELTGHDRLAVLLFEMHRAIARELDAESFGLSGKLTISDTIRRILSLEAKIHVRSCQARFNQNSFRKISWPDRKQAAPTEVAILFDLSPNMNPVTIYVQSAVLGKAK